MGHGNLQIKLGGVLIALLLHIVLIASNDRATFDIAAYVDVIRTHLKNGFGQK